MKTSLMAMMFAVFVLTGCMVQNRRGGGVEVVPILPIMVDLGDADYYAYNGYHYYYTNDRWVYSTSVGGPRMDLPRSHWPKETKRRGRGHGRGHGNH